MSDTRKHPPVPGREYNSPRWQKHRHSEAGRVSKKFTHRHERRAAARAIAGEIKEAV